jgi:hypothetical protein
VVMAEAELMCILTDRSPAGESALAETPMSTALPL